MLASLIVVGDEILSGHVQDANTSFIAGKLAEHGHALRRVAIVGDDPLDIAAEVRRDLADPTRLVFVCGGLGPTHDDRTMEGVAAGLSRSLVPCAPLVEQIEGLVERLTDAGFAGSFGVEGLRKMGLAPEGADILRCKAGGIPAVVIEDERATVFVLPGPPRELQTVFSEAIEGPYLQGKGVSVFREEISHGFPESTFAAELADLAARFPSVSIGSYPQTGHVLVRVAGPEPDVRACVAAFTAAVDSFGTTEEGKRLSEFLTARRARRGDR